MNRIIKNTILKYIPKNIPFEQKINPKRIYKLNNRGIKSGNIIYLIERNLRLDYNFALKFAIKKSKELNLPLKIIHPKINYEIKEKDNFINGEIKKVQSLFQKNNFDFEIYNGKNILNYLKNNQTSLLILDFNPILKRTWLKNADYPIYEIDSHNIIPARFVSSKMEYNAAALRRKIYPEISEFLIKESELKNKIIDDFIKNKLPFYAEFKNNPTKNITSNLSKYLNLGFISSLEIAIKVIEADVSNDNKEAYLEELIIQKELSDNFCLYGRNFKNFSDIPLWAKKSLAQHKNDIRTYIYSKDDFESAKTHDILWNACQKELTKKGQIHGYLRMYWAKKIAEWTKDPLEALQIAIYLNDKYAYDAPSPVGYTNILWAIGALHDRAFSDFPVTGKIRRMTYDSIRKKFNIKEYIKAQEE